MPEASPLQVLPQGLLGFLQLKNGGKFPQSLGSDQLQSTLDLAEWYLATNGNVQASATTNVTAVGWTQLLQGANLWVYYYDISIITDAMGAGPETIEACLTAEFDTLSVPKYVGLGDFQSANVAAQRTMFQMRNRGVFMPPDVRFGLWVKSVTGTIACTMYYRSVGLPA